MFLFQLEEAVAVVEGGGGVVDGAGTDDDKETAVGIGVLHDRHALFAAREDGGLGLRGLRDFVLEEVGRGEWIVASDWAEGG